MNPRYITLVDSNGCLAAIIPFDPNDRRYDELIGTKLGSTSLTQEDKNELLAAYGATLVENERQHVSYRWTADRAASRLEIDVLRFPSISVSAIMLSEVIQNASRPKLSARESTVIRLAASDHTDGEIAKKLKIAKATVSRHKQNIRGKLGVQEWAAAVAWAIRNGIT